MKGEAHHFKGGRRSRCVIRLLVQCHHFKGGRRSLQFYGQNENPEVECEEHRGRLLG
jgi:hypothetical protein